PQEWKYRERACSLQLMPSGWNLKVRSRVNPHYSRRLAALRREDNLDGSAARHRRPIPRPRGSKLPFARDLSRLLGGVAMQAVFLSVIDARAQHATPLVHLHLYRDHDLFSEPRADAFGDGRLHLVHDRRRNERSSRWWCGGSARRFLGGRWTDRHGG